MIRRSAEFNLFAVTWLSEFTQEHERKCHQAIKSTNEATFRENEPNCLIGDFFDRFAIPVPQLDEGSIAKEGPRAIETDRGPATQLVVFVPFVGDERLFQYRAAGFGAQVPPAAKVADGKIILTYVAERPDAGFFMESLQRDLAMIREALRETTAQLEQFHAMFRSHIKDWVAAQVSLAWQHKEVHDAIGIPDLHPGSVVEPDHQLTESEPNRVEVATSEPAGTPEQLVVDGVRDAIQDLLFFSNNRDDPEAAKQAPVALQMIRAGDIAPPGQPKEEWLHQFRVDAFKLYGHITGAGLATEQLRSLQAAMKDRQDSLWAMSSSSETATRDGKGRGDDGKHDPETQDRNETVTRMALQPVL